MKIKILEQLNYPNTVKLLIEVDIDGKKLIERFSMSHEKVEDGSWADIVKTWAERIMSEKKAPNLKGKSIEI